MCDSSPDCLFIGFPCKDLSSLNNKRISFQREKSAKSGGTFYASVDCLVRWQCPVVVFENVRMLLCRRSADEDEHRPIDCVDEVLRGHGYVGTHRLINTSDFVLPQRRLRAWLIYFKVGCGDARVAFDTLDLFATEKMIPLQMFLRREDQQAVALNGGLSPQHVPPAAAGGISPQAGAGPPAGGLSPGDAGDTGRAGPCPEQQPWRRRQAEFRVKHGLTAESLEWGHRVLRAAPAFATLPLRAQETLVARYALLKQVANIDPTVTTTVLQYDQEVHRCPVGVGFAPCICPKGQYWVSYGHGGMPPRPLTAAELAALQGIGAEELLCFNLTHVPSALLRDLAGNAFSGSVCLCVFLAVLAAWDR